MPCDVTPVRFHNSVICSLLPGFAHASMALPCKLEAAVSRATAENERASRRTPRKRNDVPPHIFEIGAQPRVFRQQGGAISSQSEDERLLDRQRQARLDADWQRVDREPKRLATALRTAWGKRFLKVFLTDFREISGSQRETPKIKDLSFALPQSRLTIACASTALASLILRFCAEV